jgi:LSD1 subclass zinc finger protein
LSMARIAFDGDAAEQLRLLTGLRELHLEPLGSFTIRCACCNSILGTPRAAPCNAISWAPFPLRWPPPV